ncbi:MAG: hypothetical protein WBA76_00375 [Phormidesmis sp.]
MKVSQQTPQTVTARQIKTQVADHSAQLVTFVDQQHKALTWHQVAQLLANDAKFCEQWNQTWADLPFDFEWKPVPIHPYTAQTHPFFAIAFPAQFQAANSQDFDRYLQALSQDELTARFNNFSGDAQLLIPANTGDFGHIADFCRKASPKARQALWQAVGEMCGGAIAQETPVWCNTHGHGVPWLHIRFDSQLKYSLFPPRGSISANSQAIWYQQIYSSS